MKVSPSELRAAPEFVRQLAADIAKRTPTKVRRADWGEVWDEEREEQAVLWRLVLLRKALLRGCFVASYASFFQSGGCRIRLAVIRKNEIEELKHPAIYALAGLNRSGCSRMYNADVRSHVQERLWCALCKNHDIRQMKPYQTIFNA